MERQASAVHPETLTGGIDSAFGERPRKKNEFMPGQSLEFTLGSGDGDVDLQTFNGSIEIREN